MRPRLRPLALPILPASCPVFRGAHRRVAARVLSVRCEASHGNGRMTAQMPSSAAGPFGAACLMSPHEKAPFRAVVLDRIQDFTI